MTFLNYYVNPTKTTLPADRTYPLGQKMFISAYNVNSTQVQKMFNNGFTAAGPWENAWPSSNTVIKSAVLKCIELGMRTSLQIRGGDIGTSCNRLRDGQSNAQVFTSWGGSGIMTSYYGTNPSDAWKGIAEGKPGPTTEPGVPFYYDSCDVWESHPEEMASRTNTCPNDSYGCCSAGVTAGINYAKYIRDYMNGWDSSSHKIMQLRTENDNAWGGGFRTRHRDVNGWMSTVVPQIFHSKIDISQSHGYLLRALSVIGDLETDAPITLPRAVSINMGSADPTSVTTERADIIGHYTVFNALALGVKHFNIYQSYGTKVGTGYTKAINKMTSYGFDQAFLWGTSNPSLKLGVTQTSGTTSYTARWTVPSLTWKQKQYKDKRYLVITNSHGTSTIGVRISGLPTGKRLVDCKTGSSSTISSTTKDISIVKNSYALYVIEAAIVTKPVVGEATADKSVYEIGDTAVVTATDSGAVSRKWWYMLSGGSWAQSTASGSTTNTIRPVLNANHNNLQYRLRSTNTIGYTDGAAVTLSVNIPLASKVKISGTWRNVKSAKVKISGTWRNVKSSKVKISGIWRTIAIAPPPPLPTVTAATPSSHTGTVGDPGVTFTASSTNKIAQNWQHKTPTGSWLNSTATGNTVTTSQLSLAHNGKTYRLRAKNFLGQYAYGAAAILTVNPDVTEKVVNGTFTTNTSGWVANNSTLSVVGGELRVKNTALTQGQARQTINVVSGKSYALKWKHTINSNHSAYFKLSGSAYASEDIYGKWSEVKGTTYTTTVVATSNKMYITMYCGTSTNNSWNYTHYDNISIIGP